MEGRLKSMTKAPRILVLTLSFGSGHVQAARTVAREIKRQSPDAEVQTVDALADCRFLFRAFYVWPYWVMVRYAPALWDRFFTRRSEKMKQNTAPTWAFRFGCPRVFKAIVDFKPDSIVATEVAACELAAIAKRDGLTRARMINVITDYEAEPVWVKREVDAYAVADDHVRDQLCAWGATAASIVICGIPVDHKFWDRHEERETRRRHSITDDAPIVLLMGGGWGPTHMNEVAARLCESGQRMHIVAATGHDRRMRRRLKRLRARPPVMLYPFGWTNDIAALMQAAAVLVTKPGGLTTAEAALSGLPVVIFDAIPGPEQRNAARLTETGAGISTGGSRETALTVLALLRDESARRRMSIRAKGLARPKAAATIAMLALNQAASSEVTARKKTA
jgi:processive 1,2-diacylglycerol beta-glucosyltransferase